MKICYFGSYLPHFSRNKILLDGLRQNQTHVYECRSMRGFFLTRYIDLTIKYWFIRNKIDVIFVAFFGHLNMPLAWILGKLTGKPVVFDVFYSMYDTFILDRQSSKIKSIHAYIYKFIDWISLTLADLVICDTITHGKYLSKLYHIPYRKFFRVFIGADDKIFKPIKDKSRKKTVIEFHGMFTRMHGVEYIIQAAKLLEGIVSIEFKIIGSSSVYLYPQIILEKSIQKNLVYLGRISESAVVKEIQKSDITLGHFGTTQKALNVISNKTYEGLACKKAVIVLNSPANREIFTNYENAIFVNAGNSKELAEKIRLLSRNKKLKEKISQNGYNLYKSLLTNKKIGLVLKNAIVRLCLTRLR